MLASVGCSRCCLQRVLGLGMQRTLNSGTRRCQFTRLMRLIAIGLMWDLRLTVSHGKCSGCERATISDTRERLAAACCLEVRCGVAVVLVVPDSALASDAKRRCHM